METSYANLHNMTTYREAAKLGLTGKAYVWVVTQSVVASSLDPAPNEFPLGMLGVHFR